MAHMRDEDDILTNDQLLNVEAMIDTELESSTATQAESTLEITSDS